MWTSRTEAVADGRGLRYTIQAGSIPISYADVLSGWRGDAGFRLFFNDLLAVAPFSAFRWETPPATAATIGGPFEFVLLDSPGLATRPDPAAFAAHFGGPGADRVVVAFPNLGGDAVLVVPRPAGLTSAYAHLAAFVREAPEPQRHALWSLVGETMGRRIGTRPVWLSTAGAGVAWLHVRLDDRPKYYGFGPYRQAGRG